MRPHRTEGDRERSAEPVRPAPAPSVSSLDGAPTDLFDDADLPASPALALRQHLAARLAAAGVVPGDQMSADDSAGRGTLPVGIQLAIIVALSVMLWGLIAVSIMEITK